MVIIEPVIRPPAEAGSFLLQVTTGCSANKCSFCGAYLNKSFYIKDETEIFKDIDAGAGIYPDIRKVFLMDGDALVIKNERLMPILANLSESFPRLTRISSYANGYNITSRSISELKELYANKLRLVYIGLESGNQEILDMCKKCSEVDEMVEAVRMAASCNIKTFAIVLLGLGGKEYSEIHIIDTIKALNKMQPRFLSFLSVMLIPGTPLYRDSINGKFEELTSMELLNEAYNIIKGLELDKTVFRCNHASNYLPLEGRLPQDKNRLLSTIESALNGKISLKPDFLRGL